MISVAGTPSGGRPSGRTCEPSRVEAVNNLVCERDLLRGVLGQSTDDEGDKQKEAGVELGVVHELEPDRGSAPASTPTEAKFPSRLDQSVALLPHVAGRLQRDLTFFPAKRSTATETVRAELANERAQLVSRLRETAPDA